MRGRLNRVARRLDRPLRTITSGARMLPSVLLIGSQKAGSTSLYRYILEHPRMLPPARKEIGFFDIYFAEGLDWYRSRFPLERPWPAATLEASTGYFDYPHAPRHIAQTLPDVRLILLVRDPVERAFSHYLHTVRMGHEPLGFEDALAAEETRTGALLARMEEDPSFYAREINYYSYLRRGRYAEHLEGWYRYFPRERLLVLQTEELAANPEGVLEKVWEFLGVPPHRPKRFERHNSAPQGKRAGMAPATRKRLEEYFAPHNRRLEQLLDLQLGWGQGASVQPEFERG
ncbi:MAG TPA: sulfotransferase domain-containing protein [Trueperaceae bacterium]